jgi:hypothetical protein
MPYRVEFERVGRILDEKLFMSCASLTNVQSGIVVLVHGPKHFVPPAQNNEWWSSLLT